MKLRLVAFPVFSVILFVALSVYFVQKNFSQNKLSVTPLEHRIIEDNSQLKSSDIEKISWGTSFGMCGGYCFTEMTITKDTIEIVKKSWSEEKEKYPDTLERFPLDPGAWEKLVILVSPQKVQSLPDKIGCPDCADQGMEWVKLETKNENKKVEFDYGKVPEELDMIVRKIREIETNLPLKK